MTRNLGRTVVSAAIVVALVVWLHQIIGNNTFSFAPAPLILSVIISYLAKNRFKLLLVLALVSELFSFFPPGIMTLIILTPLLIKTITPKTDPDLSPFFFLVVALTITLQTLLAFGYEILYLLITEGINLSQINDIIPYTTITMIIGVSTLISAAICITWREVFPIHQSGSAIFTRRSR